MADQMAGWCDGKIKGDIQHIKPNHFINMIKNLALAEDGSPDEIAAWTKNHGADYAMKNV